MAADAGPSHACRRRAASAGGRRRPPHPRPAVALPDRRGLSRHHRRQRGRRRAPSSTSLSFDLLILDVMMPGETGFEFASRMRADLQRADPDADRARRRRKPDQGPRDRRRRLCRQAVRAARTVAAHRQYPEARAAGRGAARSNRCASASSCFISARGELRKGDEVIRLTDREREMLRVLAATPGETVPRHGAGRQRRLGQRTRRRRAGQPAAPQDRARPGQSADSCRPCAASATGWWSIAHDASPRRSASARLRSAADAAVWPIGWRRASVVWLKA